MNSSRIQQALVAVGLIGLVSLVFIDSRGRNVWTHLGISATLLLMGLLGFAWAVVSDLRLK